MTSSPRRPADRYGLELTTTQEAAAPFCEALERLLSLEEGAEELLAAALELDPDFSLAHAVAATAGFERGEDRDVVRHHLHAARHGSHRATEREASFVTTALLWCIDGLSGDTSLIRHVRTWPTDAYALSLVTPSIATSGLSAGVVDVWALLDEVAPHYPAGDWWLDSIRAFARTEQYRWTEAEELAGASLEACPAAGHAAHALAHVWYETGRHSQALAWLDSWLAGPGRHQSFRGHFAWHAAVVELASGDVGAVTRRFDDELAGLTGTRALIDGASLLARAEAQGHSLGSARAERVLAAAGAAATAPATPFLAWHAALLAALRRDEVGLVALGEVAREQTLAAQQDRAKGASVRAWCLVRSVCRAAQATLDGDYPRAAALFLSLGDTAPLGGSPAQRELLDDLALRCLDEAGEVDAAALLAAARLTRRPGAWDLDLAARGEISASR